MPPLSVDLDTLGQVIARGGGMNELFGPVHFHKYIWIGLYSTDPSTTGWGLPEAGRIWFNTTTHQIKYWDGSAIQVVGGGGAHALLSATHSDTLAAGVVAGDVLIGNTTPKWTRVPAGVEGQIFEQGAVLPGWGRKITISTASPSGGNNGDLWLKYTA